MLSLFKFLLEKQKQNLKSVIALLYGLQIFYFNELRIKRRLYPKLTIIDAFGQVILFCHNLTVTNDAQHSKIKK